MTYNDILRLYEKKDHLINRTPMTDEQKQEVIAFFHAHREQERNISDGEWNKPETLTYERFKQVMDAFNSRQTRSRANKISNKLGISGIVEGIDYADLGEYDSPVLGKYHAYVPLSWLGTKTIAGSRVSPNYKNYTSAKWCIGQSDSNKYFRRYFAERNYDFLILCGEGIPTKKVCIQMRDDTDYCCWDYMDSNTLDGDKPYQLDFLIQGNTPEDKKEKERIFGLMERAKEFSQKRREQYFKEFKNEEPILLLKSEYIDKLKSFRGSNTQNGVFGYKDCVSKALEFFSFMDSIYLEGKNIKDSFKLTLYSFESSKKWNGTYTDWYKENKDKVLSNVNFYPFFLLNYIPNYTELKSKSFINTSSLKINSQLTLKVEITVIKSYSPRYKALCKPESSIIDRNPYFSDGERSIISEFNNLELLTVKDLVALLGGSLLNSQYEENSSCKSDGIKLSLVSTNSNLPVLGISRRILNSKDLNKEAITLYTDLFEAEKCWYNDYIDISSERFEIQKRYLNPKEFMESKDIEAIFSLVNFVVSETEN